MNLCSFNVKNYRRIVIFALTSFFFFSLFSPAFAGSNKASVAKRAEVPLKLLYTNDIHSCLNGFTVSLAGGATERRLVKDHGETTLHGQGFMDEPAWSWGSR